MRSRTSGAVAEVNVASRKMAALLTHPIRGAAASARMAARWAISGLRASPVTNSTDEWSQPKDSAISRTTT